MIFVRQLLLFIRGNSSGFNIVMGCVLGALMGSLPVPEGIPLLLAFACVLLIVSTNLFLAGLLFAITKLLTLSFYPQVDWMGETIIGAQYLHGFWTMVCTAPILAWAGFEYYRITGGLAVGFLVGLTSGLLCYHWIKHYRQTVLKRLHSGKSVDTPTAKSKKKNLWRFFGFLFWGKSRTEASYVQLLTNPSRNPFRWSGLILSGLLLISTFWFFHNNTALLTNGLQRILEQINGATVELTELSVDARKGDLILNGLQICDPMALDENLLQIDGFSARLSIYHLLKKEIHLDRVTLSGFSIGNPRSNAGIRYRSAPTPLELPSDAIERSVRFLEKIVVDLPRWQSRIELAQRWYRRYGLIVAKINELDPKRQIRKQIAKQREKADDGSTGLAKQESLIKQRTTFKLEQFNISGILLDGIEEEIIHLKLAGITDKPRLSDVPISIHVANEAETIAFSLSLGSLSPLSQASNRIKFHWEGLPIDKWVSQLKAAQFFPLKGGFVDLSIDASFQKGQIQFPINTTFWDTELQLPQLGATRIHKLEAPNLIKVSGDWKQPKIEFQKEAFTELSKTLASDALARFAAQQSKNFVDQELLDLFGTAFKGTGLEDLLTWVEKEQMPIGYIEPSPTANWFSEDVEFRFPRDLQNFRLFIGHDSYLFETQKEGVYLYDRKHEPIQYHYEWSEDRVVIHIELDNQRVETYTLSRYRSSLYFQADIADRNNSTNYEGEFFARGDSIYLVF